MSKWRPTTSGCLYVVPDIHGSVHMLDRICSRILPLRRTGGVQDRIIFLGDYIDRHIDSHLVLDRMVEIKNEYKDNVICLIGNHELLLLETLGLAQNYNGYFDLGTNDAHQVWMSNGGYQTLSGYINRTHVTRNAERLPRHRIKDFIPEEHLNFLLNLQYFYETNEYIFVHAGCDPYKPLNDQPLRSLAWDRDLFNFVKNGLRNNETFEWPKTIVSGHSHNGPLINEKYLMLDCGAPKQMLLSELNSMDGFMVYPDKDRMIKFDIVETKVKKPVFRRVN